MDLNCIVSMAFLLITTFVQNQNYADAQKNLQRSSNNLLWDGRNPECEFRCKKAGKRKFCGSDGRTFSTACQARREKCLDPMLTTKPGKCKEATCFQARNYSLRKSVNGAGRHAVYIPTCTSEGRYSPRQCHIDFCWCVTSDGRMVPDSAVENEEPSCITGNVRRSTDSCASNRRSTLFASVRSKSLREYRKATPLAEFPPSSDDLLRLALSWKFSSLDRNSNGNLNARELRTFFKHHHARQCGPAFTDLCDLDVNQQIAATEWIECLFTPSSTTPTRQPVVVTTTPTTDILNVPHDTPSRAVNANCLSEDQTSLIDKVRNEILRSHARESPSRAPVTEEERENTAILWKFTELDRDGNAEVTTRESRSFRRTFRRFNFKECFLDICNTDGNGVLTQTEWTTCFAAHKRSRCIDERREALKLQRAQDGVYVPVCEGEDMRFFSQVQCHAGTGYCWCTARETGRPIPGTSTQGSSPNCEGSTPTRATTLAIPGCRKPAVFIASLHDALLREMIQQEHSTASEESLDEIVNRSSFTANVATWFFERLDRNSDSNLSGKEAKAVKKMLRRKVSPKRCLRRYMRFCDSDRSKKVSQTEFHSCLQIPSAPTTAVQSTSSRLPILE